MQKTQKKTGVLKNFNANINYTFLKSIKPSSPFFLGASFSNHVAVRDHLKLDIFGNYIASIGATFLYQKSFLIKKFRFTLQSKWNLPLLNLIFTPGYGYSPPEGYLKQNPKLTEGFFKSLDFIMFPKLFKINHQLFFKTKIRNNNYLQLLYEWDFYSFKHFEKISQGYNSLQLGWSLNF